MGLGFGWRHRFGAKAAALAADEFDGQDSAQDCDEGARPLLAWRNLVQRALIAFGLAALFAHLLMQRLSDLDFSTVFAAFGAVSAASWAGALVLTGAAFWAVGQYDVILHRHFATGVAPRIARRAGISAIAVSQTLGLGVITGAVLRWRMLHGHGAGNGLMLASRITVAVALSFLLGWAVVTALVILALGPPDYAPYAAAVLAVAVLGTLCCIAAPRISFGKMRLHWPNMFTLAGLLALCAVDTLAAAAALFVLLPAEVMLPFAALLPAFLLAYGAGILSGTPGGVGAFELTLLALLQSPSEAPILAAVLAWRLIYFVLPALVGAGLAICAQPAGAQVLDIQTYDKVDDLPAARAGVDLMAVAETGIGAQHPSGSFIAKGTAAWLAAPLGHVMVGLFDPIAQRGSGRDQSGAEFALLAGAARARGLLPVGYKLSSQPAARARAARWRVWRIAREAVLSPSDFDLSCPARAALRRKLRRAEGAGISAAYCPPNALPRAELDDIAQDWARTHGGERGFSMGRYAQGYIAAQRVYVARGGGGDVVAFITFHQRGGEWTLDIMRHRANLPDGAIHALVLAALRDARLLGVARLSLAAVPQTAFAPKGAGAPALTFLARRWLGRWVHLDAGHGLRQFKDSFAPKWEPRYLCAPSRFALLLGALSIARAVLRPYPLLPTGRRPRS
jgi:phosphatidylglycerol lysyltransferase